MYNKLFTKILDSSIWLEPIPTRVVWLTLIAAMDEEGFAQFASAANLAHRARVSVKAAEEAVAALEGPDVNSSDQENDGKRIERVPGGWMVLNAKKYQELVTRAVEREQTRLRVAKFRGKKDGNADVTVGNDSVTPSDTDSYVPPPPAQGVGSREIPDWQSVKAYAFSIGLPEWKARDCFDEMESCGWIDSQSRPIRKWKSAVNKWKSWWENDGMSATRQKNNGRSNKNSATSSRNAGTCNDGLSGQYAGIGL